MESCHAESVDVSYHEILATIEGPEYPVDNAFEAAGLVLFSKTRQTSHPFLLFLSRLS